MLIASIADLHLRGSDLDTALVQLTHSMKAMLEADADMLLIAGDVFDHPNVGDRHASTGEIVKKLHEALHTVLWPEWKPIVIIPGNHDKANDASLDALPVLHGFRPIEIYREPRIVHYMDGCDKDIGIVMLPWMWSQTPAEALDAIEWNREETTILLAHMRVQGAKFNATREIGEGTFTIDKQTLEAYNFDHLVLGDIHLRQEVLPGKGGYVGAIRQLNFGEEANPAGFELYNTETNTTRWVEVDQAPQYKTLRWLEGETPNLESYPNTHLRLQAYHWQPTAAEIKAYTQQGIRVDIIAAPSERVRRGEMSDEIANNDDTALLKLWLDQQEPAPSATKRKALQKELTNLTL